MDTLHSSAPTGRDGPPEDRTHRTERRNRVPRPRRRPRLGPQRAGVVGIGDRSTGSFSRYCVSPTGPRQRFRQDGRTIGPQGSWPTGCCRRAPGRQPPGVYAISSGGKSATSCSSTSGVFRVAEQAGAEVPNRWWTETYSDSRCAMHSRGVRALGPDSSAWRLVVRKENRVLFGLRRFDGRNRRRTCCCRCRTRGDPPPSPSARSSGFRMVDSVFGLRSSRQTRMTRLASAAPVRPGSVCRLRDQRCTRRDTPASAAGLPAFTAGIRSESPCDIPQPPVRRIIIGAVSWPQPRSDAARRPTHRAETRRDGDARVAHHGRSEGGCRDRRNRDLKRSSGPRRPPRRASRGPAGCQIVQHAQQHGRDLQARRPLPLDHGDFPTNMYILHRAADEYQITTHHDDGEPPRQLPENGQGDHRGHQQLVGRKGSRTMPRAVRWRRRATNPSKPSVIPPSRWPFSFT